MSQFDDNPYHAPQQEQAVVASSEPDNSQPLVNWRRIVFWTFSLILILFTALILLIPATRRVTPSRLDKELKIIGDAFRSYEAEK